MFVNDIFKKQLNENQLDEISRRDFLKGAGAAALAGTAGYKIGQNDSGDLSNPDVKKLSADDIRTIDEKLLYHIGSGNQFKNGPREQFEFETKKFIKAYGPEGKNLLNARYKKMQDYYDSLNDIEKEAVIAKLGKKVNDFYKLIPNFDESIEQGMAEAGPFSYGAKKPRKGSVADLAAQKRKEQEKGKQPAEPRDQMVGTARVKKDVAEGFLGDRTFNRVMPMVKRIAGEVSDYDRDEFGEELWSLLDQKYGPKFAQSVLQDELDFYWNEYTELTGQDLAEGSVYKKDQDLSDVSTQELEAFVRKHWFGGVPTYGQGESVKRAIRELRRREKQGVAESISVVDQDYDLDQMHLILDIEGKKVSFTYWDYEEDFSNAERRDVFDQLQEQPWYKGLDHPTKMEILNAAYRAIRGLEPQEYRPTVGDEPLDEQGVAEGAGEKLLSKMVPGGASVFNAADAVRRFRSGDKVGAAIAAGGVVPITAIPAAAADLARDKYYTGSWLPSDEQRDLANLNRQVADMEKKNWKTLPDGSERSPDGQTIRGTVTKLSAEPQSKPVPSSMKPDSAELPSKSYPDDVSSVKEGSTQEKLYRRHQELRKKSGLPDPNYYKELKATYNLPDAERYAKQKELKQKYKVTNEELPAPTADQTNTDDLDQLSKQMRATVPKTRVDTTKWTDEQRFLQDKKVGKFLGSSFDEWKQQQNRTTQSAMPTNEDRERYIEELQRAGYEIVTERRMTCPECGGAAYEDKILAEKQDACYHKVKSRYKVWPSAYASGALVRCRKKGAKNWGNKSKK